MVKQEWYSASELAGLPGLPGTTAAIRNRSRRSGWTVRLVQGSHNAMEFHISSLPEETREHLGDFSTNDEIEQKEIEQTRTVASDSHPAQSYIDDQQRYRMAAAKRQAWQESHKGVFQG